MLDRLRDAGFQIRFLSHAESILSGDFPGIPEELEAALLNATVPIEEIIAGGGGEAKGTQRLRKALTDRHWNKLTFVVEKIINGVRRESQSHIVDHVRSLPDGSRIALEIEWNNKDPFFDRDLENFKRLHADGAISVGVIVTRGDSLQRGLREAVRRFLEEQHIDNLDQLAPFRYRPTIRQRDAIQRRAGNAAITQRFRDSVADVLVADKFGAATTHWGKLDDRVQRGVGNPCPLLLIGLPMSIVTFGEPPAAINAILSDEE